MSGETELRRIDAIYQNADCLTKHASRKSEGQSYRKFCRKHNGELRQKRTCWTNANENERSVTVPLATKNRGLRAIRQLA